MTVEHERKGNVIKFTVKGKVGAVTAPDLKAVVESTVDDEIKQVIFDFSDVDYISSAGLRVLLMTQYLMDDRDGEVDVTGVSDLIMDIFEETGFNTFLNVTQA